MSLVREIAVSALVAAHMLVSGFACAGEPEVYMPEEGDEVVVYIHRFKATDYEKGRDLVEQGFSAAITEHGQTRRTMFLENAEALEVMAISFFHSSASVEDWHESSARSDVLDQLEPLRSEPLVVKRYTMRSHHHHRQSSDSE